MVRSVKHHSRTSTCLFLSVVSTLVILINSDRIAAGPPTAGAQQIPDGSYFITNRNSGFVLDIPNANLKPAKVDQGSNDEENNQKWQITNLGASQFRIANLASGLVLGIAGESKDNGGQMEQQPPSGNASQRWTLTSAGAGFYQLVNVNSGLAIEAPGWSVVTGTVLDQGSVGGGANEQWSLTPTAPTRPGKIARLIVTARLGDPKATRSAKALYRYLESNLGTRIISGQTDQNKFDYVTHLTGRTSMIRDFDMQPYSPQYSYLWSGTAINPKDGKAGYYSFGPDSQNRNTDNAIRWYKNTGCRAIIDFQWHWHSPMGGTVGTNSFNADSTTFDVSRAVMEGTPEYIASLRDIDAIAIQLQKLSDADVPIIWRPLHEAGGGGFWWDAKGPQAYVALWNIVYDRLVRYHQLHHLIWAWTGDDPKWYPGNARVDILGIDSYPGNFNYGTNKAEYKKISAICGGNKVLAMTENGPVPDISKCLSNGAPWAFFMCWGDVTEGNDDRHLKVVYNDSHVITLEHSQ